MTSIKKIIAIATALTCFSMIAGPALPSYAMTAEELQNQIETLTQQLADLQAQLTTLRRS